jgi:tRNA threonylcarbamoyladenosine biosynthesis protein TsaE
MEWTFSMNNIHDVAKEFWKQTAGKTVFAFHGPMGMGKTTFIHALCDVKGVKEGVGSPTFSIINEYQYVPVNIGSNGTPGILFHIDLYRLRDEEEALRAGVEDILFSGNLCLVEWPERVPDIFPDDTLHCFIEMVDEKTRRLKIADI